jgi:hypothetical protein
MNGQESLALAPFMREAEGMTIPTDKAAELAELLEMSVESKKILARAILHVAEVEEATAQALRAIFPKRCTKPNLRLISNHSDSKTEKSIPTAKAQGLHR